MTLKRDGGPGDGGGAPDHGADESHPITPTTPDQRAMRLQQLKHMVEADAYRVDPQDVAVALLLRVDPRRDLFTGLLSRPDARSREGRADRSGPAA